MDICSNIKEQVSFECKHHKNYKPWFFSLNSGDSEEDILYCCECLEQSRFNKQYFEGFQSIDNLLHSNDRTIFHKWPPILNQNILTDIKLIIDDNKNVHFENQKNQIEQFFDSLHEKINKCIDNVKKQMLIECGKILDVKDDLLECYQKAADILTIKEVLVASDTDYEQANSKMKQILKTKEQQKGENEEILQKQLSVYNSKLQQFESNNPEKIMIGILQLVNQITFYPDQTCLQASNGSNFSTNIEVELMKMIANKTNRCSQQFIEEVNQTLSQYSILFNKLNNTTIYQDGVTHPIDFNEITQEDLVRLEQLAKNLSKKSTQDIPPSPEIQFLLQLINSPTNYLINEFQEKLTDHLQQLSPFLNQIDIKNSTVRNRNPINFKGLQQNQVFLLDKLVKKMIQIGYTSDCFEIKAQTLPHSKVVYSCLQKSKYEYLNELLPLLKHYPICELIQFEEFEFQTSSCSQNSFEITYTQNNQIKFTNYQEYSNDRIISNQFLDPNKTYKIQFSFSNFRENYSNYIILKSPIDSKRNLSFSINSEGQTCNNQIDKILVGNPQNMKNFKEFELVINLKKGSLMIMDFPSKNNVISINENSKIQLQNENQIYQLAIQINRIYDSIIIQNIEISE